MNFKEVLVHQDITNDKDSKEFETWEVVSRKINKKTVCNKKNNNIYSDAKYNIICQNDHIIYDLTKELKERFELKGLMVNCDMSKLIDIFMKNMKLEEILEDEDDDEYFMEEDENIF